MDNDDQMQRELGLGAVENLSTAVTLLDDQLRVAYLNSAAEMLFAVSRRKAQRRPLVELLLNGELFLDTLRASLAEGQVITEREVALMLADGQRVTVDCTATPLTDTAIGRALLLEIRQLDHHLRIAREEHLLAQQQATSALLRGLAHEIRNPLGGLRGAAQLLERELGDMQLKEYTGVIINEADRLEDLVNRMLGPRSGREKRPINIHEVLERVRVLVQAEVSPDIRLVANYDPSIPTLRADSDQLIQAFLNIVRNAAQALGKSGEITLQTRIERQVAIGPHRHRLAARIDIIDNGPGIAPQMIEHIFFPMVTDRPDGSGLGLSIAQSLINQHGGLIECTSVPGRTVFTVRLPVDETP